jgi:TonB family protein
LIRHYKELFIQLHEFEADARAVENSDVNKYCSLLARVALQSHFPIASHFNESLTVKRIEMMRTLKKKIEKWKIAAVLLIVAGCFVAISCNDQLIDEMEKSTVSQVSEYPNEIRDQMNDYLKEHPAAKLTYLEGTPADVDQLEQSADVKNRVVYVYKYKDNEKKGILLTDVVQYAEALQNEDKVFMVVEQQPEFIGGYDAMRNFLAQNTKYPTQARTNNESGTVYVSMIINEDGSVSNAKVLRGVSQSIDAEAVRVISIMPNWKPGMQNGKPVKVRFNIPIKFSAGKQDGPYYEVPVPQVGEISPSNFKMSIAQFEKKPNGTGTRFVGRVVDEKGKGLAGATIIIQGTTTGTKTDSQGSFALETEKKTGNLVFSFIGFETQSKAF